MKIGTIIFVAIILTILFGAVPLMFVGNLFCILGNILKSIGNALDFFNWGGVLAISPTLAQSIMQIRGAAT